MLIIGAADMGTGCDTILAQMVAEHMDCSVDDVSVFGADTDASPYDSAHTPLPPRMSPAWPCKRRVHS